MLVGGGLAFVIGRRADRVGIRTLVITGFVLGAIGLIAFGRSTQPWHIVAASWLLMGPAAGLTFYEPAFIAVDQWFDRTPPGQGTGRPHADRRTGRPAVPPGHRTPRRLRSGGATPPWCWRA